MCQVRIIKRQLTKAMNVLSTGHMMEPLKLLYDTVHSKGFKPASPGHGKKVFYFYECMCHELSVFYDQPVLS